MKLNLGFIRSESQFLLMELDTSSSEIEKKALDTVEIKETPLNLLFFSGENPPEGLQKTLESENKFYPIAPADSLGLELETFESLNYQELCDLFAKVNSRWIMNNNIQFIENQYPVVSHLSRLWSNDRNAFFEELWFTLKTNLATTELTAVFHDVKEPEQDKSEKPSLFYSYVYGKKTPQLFEGKEREDQLMKEYENEFGESLSITEFNSEKGHLVAAVKIGLSPILILAKLKTFNQLQKSILIGIFQGLQENAQ